MPGPPLCSARVRKASGIVGVTVPAVRRWNLAVQTERLRAETVGTVCLLSGFVITRMTVVTAQMRRVSVFTRVALTGTVTEFEAAASVPMVAP